MTNTGLDTTGPKSNRRDFLKKGSAIVAASAMAGVAVPHVFAAEDNTIRLALIGCGGRGSGAVVNAMSTPSGPVKLVAVADVFEEKVKAHFEPLREKHKDSIDVPPERIFIGMDGYRKA